MIVFFSFLWARAPCVCLFANTAACDCEGMQPHRSPGGGTRVGNTHTTAGTGTAQIDAVHVSLHPAAPAACSNIFIPMGLDWSSRNKYHTYTACMHASCMHVALLLMA